MYLKLRIIFSVLAAICAAAAIFVFVFAGWVWGTVVVALCLIFAALMFICRNKQIAEEQKENPPESKGDFITGKVDKTEVQANVEVKADTKRDE